FLEFFRHSIIFVHGYEIPELGEEIGVLACRVWPVHRDERGERVHQFPPLITLLPAAWDVAEDGFGDLPPGLMLSQQRIDEISHDSRFLEMRKHMLLFRLLVIVLDELANDL